MHLVLAGEFLRRLNVWLDGQGNNGFLSNSKEKVDCAMLNVKFPHDFNCAVRPVSELKRWKDREVQNLFLHGSLPILNLFFPAEYFCHFYDSPEPIETCTSWAKNMQRIFDSVKCNVSLNNI